MSNHGEGPNLSDTVVRLFLIGPVCVLRCSRAAHVSRSKSRTAVKFLLSSFLSVIIASQLTNYRSVVVVFSSLHTTGEACVCLAGCHFLTGSARQVLVTLPGTRKHKGSEAGTIHFFLNVLPTNFLRGKIAPFQHATRKHVQMADNSITQKKNTHNVSVYEIIWQKFAIVNFLCG